MEARILVASFRRGSSWPTRNTSVSTTRLRRHLGDEPERLPHD